MQKERTKRVNIILPTDTLEKIDRADTSGNRSRFINEAVEHYVRETGRANLRVQLTEEAQTRAQRNRDIAEEWFHVEEEV